MNYSVYNAHYPVIYPYQAPQYEQRTYYPVNPYYAHPTYYDNRFYTVPTYPANEENNYIDSALFSDRQGNVVTLRNLGISSYQGYFLDIDPRTRHAVLTERETATGIRWKMNQLGGGVVTLQNLGDSPYKGYFLDIDPRTGHAVLTERETATGIRWLLTRSGSE